MTLTASDVLVVIVLISCIPLQYFLIENWGRKESDRNYALQNLHNHLKTYWENSFRINLWLNWFGNMLGLPMTQGPSKEFDDYGESPAIEVMNYRNRKGFFGFSSEIRSFRPPEVRFHVGQVVFNKLRKYRGVIVGWDEKAKATDEWFQVMLRNNQEWRDMPNYSILIDTRDRFTPQFSYDPQENLIVLKNTKILHPLIDEYFESFDGEQYIPRPKLKTVYPQD